MVRVAYVPVPGADGTESGADEEDVVVGLAHCLRRGKVDFVEVLAGWRWGLV